MNTKIFNFTKFLNKEELEYLKLNIKKVKLKKDTILFYQDDICPDILLLEDGEVSLYIYGDESNEQINLYTISKGEQCIINTASTISQTNVIANAVTLTDCNAYLMSYSVVKKLMRMSEEYQDFIFSLFSIKFNSLTSLIEDIKYKKLDARILAILTARNEKYIIITHEQLANKLSTSRVVISRVLKDLENKKKIKLHRGKIEVL